MTYIRVSTAFIILKKSLEKCSSVWLESIGILIGWNKKTVKREIKWANLAGKPLTCLMNGHLGRRANYYKEPHLGRRANYYKEPHLGVPPDRCGMY